MLPGDSCDYSYEFYYYSRIAVKIKKKIAKFVKIITFMLDKIGNIHIKLELVIKL